MIILLHNGFVNAKTQSVSYTSSSATALQTCGDSTMATSSTTEILSGGQLVLVILVSG